MSMLLFVEDILYNAMAGCDTAKKAKIFKLYHYLEPPPHPLCMHRKKRFLILISIQGNMCRQRARNTRICCRAFSSGSETTHFNELGLSRPGFKRQSPACKIAL